MARIKIARGSKNNLPGGLASDTLLYGELFWEKQQEGQSDGVLLMGHPDGVEDGVNNKDPLPIAGARAMKSLFFEGLWDAATGTYPADPQVGSFWIASSDGTGTAASFKFGDWAICIAVNPDTSTQWIKSINQTVTTTDPLALERNPLDLTAGVISLKYDSNTLTVDSTGKLAVKLTELFTVANEVVIPDYSVVAINTGGEAILGDFTTEATGMAAGIALQTTEGSVEVQKHGRLTNLDWTFSDVGGPVYLGAAGALIQGSENIQSGYIAIQLGIALNTTTLEINIGQPFLYTLPSDINYIPLTNTVTSGDTAHAPTADAVYQVITGASIPTSGNIIPSQHDVYNIGSPTARFNHVYANEIHVDTHSVYLGTLELVQDPTLGFAVVDTALPVEERVPRQVLTPLTISTAGISADLIPDTDMTRSIGSAAKRFSHLWADEVHVGANTLYVNGKAVIQDVSSSMTFSTDIDQTVLLKTIATVNGIGNANIILQAANKIEMTALGGANFTVPSNVAGKDLVFTNNSSGGLIRFSGDTTHTGNVTVNGNLTITGTTTTLNVEQITIKDNLITLNSNQTGTPSSALVSGIDVERGDETNYRFAFVELDNTFKVGQNGSLQAVATRQDTPSASGVPYWNATLNRFDTEAGFTYNATTDNLTAVKFTGNLTGNVTGDVTGNVTGNVSGNAGTATKLATARTIALTGDVTASGSFDGSGNLSLTTLGVAAAQLTTARTIALAGGVTGSASFDGSSNISITSTVVGLVAGATGTGALAYNGTTKSAGRLDGGTVAPTNTTRLNYDGNFHATNFHGNLTGNVTGTASGNLTSASTLDATKLSGTVPNASISGSYTGLTNLTGTGTVDFGRFLGNAADTVSAPSFSWTGDLNTGIYQPAADQVAITTGGVQRALFNSSGITGTFIGNVTGNVSGSSGSCTGNAATASTADAVRSVAFNTGTTAPTVTTRLNCEGYLYATRVYGAVWNDIADFIEVPENTVVEYGKLYVMNEDGSYSPSSEYLAEGIIGIATDTFGLSTGTKDGVKQIPIAVSGFALAHVDKVYRTGTPLTTDINGTLTEIKQVDKREYPERIVATFWKEEKAATWNDSIAVNGRHWVKVR